MLYALTGWIQHGPTDLFEPPVVHRSGNGWVYKPDEARTPHEIKRGLNKAWPRSPRHSGNSADEKASVWLDDFIQAELQRHAWAIPLKIEKPVTSPQTGGSHSFSVGWKSDPWGWQGVSIDISDGRSRYYRNQSASITYKVHTHKAIVWWAKQKVEGASTGFSSSPFTESNTINTPDREQLRKMVQQWIADPWGATKGQFNSQYERLMQPPVEKMRGLAYEGDKDDVNGDFFALSSGNAPYWLKGTIEQVMTSDVAWKSLEKIMTAFQFMGYETRIITSHNYTGSDEITGVEIEIPEDLESNSRSRKAAHTFKITTDGISVTCGFVQDEEKWIDRETRMAKEHMALLEKDLFTEFSIDLTDE